MGKFTFRNWKLEELKSLLLVIFIFVSNLSFSQFNIPKKPNFQTSVYDYAKILSEFEKSDLENKLVKYSDSTSTQIVVITIDDLKGEYIGELAPKWGQTWGIGDKDKDNGILILLSKNDRKIWIAPGYGAEVQLVAGVNGEIIRNVIVPEFKSGNFYAGLDKGTDAIFKVLQGKYKGQRKEKAGNILPFILLIGFFVFFIFIMAKNKGNNGGNSGGFGGPDLMDVIILSRMGRGGGLFGGSGSSGGGGFGGGFGGGGFSGGGAGGDW
jgi:uncharacterized protein